MVLYWYHIGPSLNNIAQPWLSVDIATLSVACVNMVVVDGSATVIPMISFSPRDCVFRTNQAPISTHESDVGRRTTVRVVGHPSWPKIKKDKNTLLVGAQRPTHLIVWGPFIPNRRKHLEKDIVDFVQKYDYPDIK